VRKNLKLGQLSKTKENLDENDEHFRERATKIAKSLLSDFIQRKGCDITILTNGRPVYCHMCVLTACSETFEMRFVRNDSIDLHSYSEDIVSKAVMSAYTGNFDLNISLNNVAEVDLNLRSGLRLKGNILHAFTSHYNELVLLFYPGQIRQRYCPKGA
jgi:hypothetical protein